MNIDRVLLQRKVETRNKVNAKANELRIELAKILQPFVGKKVIKVTPYKQWTAAVSKVLYELTSAPEFDGPHEGSFRLVWDFYQYSIYATLDTTYPVSDSSVDYVKREFAVCPLDGDLLKGFPVVDPARTDYTVDGVTEDLTKLEELRAEVSTMESKLREFIK
jgi:hypothetical protein